MYSGGGKAVPGDIIVPRHLLFENIDRESVASVAEHPALLWGRLGMKRLVGHRLFDRPGGEEQPAIIIGAIGRRRGKRSEEHTSELQSLMRISYAVFCLKKKKKNTITKERRTTVIYKITTESNTYKHL